MCKQGTGSASLNQRSMEIQAAEAKSILEAALLCALQPMPLKDMQLLLGEGTGAEAVRALLLELQADWSGRGLELVQLAGGWRFQTRLQLRSYLERLHPERPQRYSRAAMETLAVIAYRQPVTRGDIEDIRGVVVSSQIVRQLEERGWIESIGHREAPGRPALYATTRQFLEDLGLQSLSELPTLDAMLATGLAPEQGSLLPETEDAGVPAELTSPQAEAADEMGEGPNPAAVASETAADPVPEAPAAAESPEWLPQEDPEASAP